MANSKDSPHHSRLSFLKVPFLLSALAALLLIIATSALWFNQYVFDSKNFTSIATQSLLSASSRDALAAGITDRVLEERPAVRSVVGDQSTKLISGLLDTDQAQALFSRAILKLQTTITSKNPQPIELNLSGLKDTLGQILAVVGKITDKTPEEQRIQVGDIPDKIVLVDTAKLPNIYTTGMVLLWVGPLFLLVALVLLALPIYRHWRSPDELTPVLFVQGAVLCIGGLFALLIGPLFKPPILANVPGENGRVIVENLYLAFIGKFNELVVSIFVLSALLLLTSLLLHLRKRDVFRRGRTTK